MSEIQIVLHSDLFFLRLIYFILRERERERERKTDRQTGKGEGERILSRLCIEHGAQLGARSHDLR